MSRYLALVAGLLALAAATYRFRDFGSAYDLVFSSIVLASLLLPLLVKELRTASFLSFTLISWLLVGLLARLIGAPVDSLMVSFVCGAYAAFLLFLILQKT